MTNEELLQLEDDLFELFKIAFWRWDTFIFNNIRKKLPITFNMFNFLKTTYESKLTSDLIPKNEICVNQINGENFNYIQG